MGACGRADPAPGETDGRAGGWLTRGADGAAWTGREGATGAPTEGNPRDGTAPPGDETEALPVSWEKKGDFMTLLAKFESEAGAAAASIKDEASFKDAWPKVMGNCGTCHKAYRKPKS